ncbi:flocculation protein FLO11-like [Sergentomyia squamirostris]
MNLLTPDDVLYGMRRKSVCSGSIGSSSTTGTGGKCERKKEKRRRGSLSEPVPLRRTSLVQRWFKHISDAAEAYKARTRGVHDLNTDAVSSGGSKEKDSSFEMTPERTEFPALSSGGSSLDQPTVPASEKKASEEIRRRGGGGEAREKRKSQKQQQKPQDVLRSRSKQKKDSEESRDSANEDNEADEQNERREEEEEEADEEKRTEDEESAIKQKFNGYSNTCNTRTLTQQCSLVAPSEVQITVSPSMTAEPVLTLAERLRRLDESIKEKLLEKQKIVCDMFRMPNEHFSAIADIAGQPEAPKDPSDLVLAAFAQVQQLTETVNEFTRVSQMQEISAVSVALCDDCHKSRSNVRTPHPVLTREDSIQEDEDGYCEIVELRTVGPPAQQPVIAATPRTDQLHKRRSTNSIPEETESEIRSEAQQQPSGRIEINETYVGADEKPKIECDIAVDGGGKEMCGPNRLLHATSLTPSVPCHLISSHTSALNTLVSQLLPKLNERDVERDMLRRENQHLRELINSLHERERVSLVEETPLLDTDPEITTISKNLPTS